MERLNTRFITYRRRYDLYLPEEGDLHDNDEVLINKRTKRPIFHLEAEGKEKWAEAVVYFIHWKKSTMDVLKYKILDEGFSNTSGIDWYNMSKYPYPQGYTP